MTIFMEFILYLNMNIAKLYWYNSFIQYFFEILQHEKTIDGTANSCETSMPSVV